MKQTAQSHLPSPQRPFSCVLSRGWEDPAHNLPFPNVVAWLSLSLFTALSPDVLGNEHRVLCCQVSTSLLIYILLNIAKQGPGI